MLKMPENTEGSSGDETEVKEYIENAIYSHSGTNHKISLGGEDLYFHERMYIYINS